MSYRKHLVSNDIAPSEIYAATAVDSDKDTISRQAAKDMIKNHKSDFSTEKDYRTARACVNAVPPAGPQIIRCKDCRHRDEFGCCKYWVGLTMGMPTTATDDDDFCSYAKRRTE